MTDLCDFRRSGETGVACEACGLRLGFAGPHDCPRRREPYGRGAPVDLAPVARPSTSRAIARGHRIGGR